LVTGSSTRLGENRLANSRGEGCPNLKKLKLMLGARGLQGLLDLSCFGRPMIHFQTAQKLVVNYK